MFMPTSQTPTLNSLAYLFAPTSTARKSTRNPQAANFVPTSMSQPSTLNPQAAAFSPTLSSMQQSILDPEAAIFTPGIQYKPLRDLSHTAIWPDGCASAGEWFARNFAQWLAAFENLSKTDSSALEHEHSDTQEEVSSNTEMVSDVGMGEAPALEEEACPSFNGDAVMDFLDPTNDTESSAVEELGSNNHDTSACSTVSTAEDDEYDEYKSQEKQMYRDLNIHHFNFFGQGVMHKTSTPSAVSLAVVLSPAKAQMVDSENLRDSTILREAFLAIDPVVYHGDLNNLKNLKGEELREKVIGATAPYYSGFGRWRNDNNYENDELPLLDELDETRYLDGTTVVNGYFDNGAPTRWEVFADANAAYKLYIAKQERIKKDKNMFGVGGSGLLTMVILNDGDCIVSTSEAKCAIVTGASCILPKHKVPGLAGDATATTLDASSEKTHIAAPELTKSPFDINFDVHFGTGDWADDEEIGDAYLAQADTTRPAITSAKVVASVPVDKDTADLSAKVSATSTIPSTDNGTVTGLTKATLLKRETGKSAESVRSAPRFKPCISGTGKTRFVLVEPILINAMFRMASEKATVVPALRIADSAPALELCSDVELVEEGEELYDSLAEVSDTTAGGSSFNSSRSSSSSNLGNPTSDAADKLGALEGRSQGEIDEKDDFLYGPVLEVAEPDEPLEFTMLTRPYRPKPAMVSAPELPEPGKVSVVKTFDLAHRSKPVMASVPDTTNWDDYDGSIEAFYGTVRVSGWKTDKCPYSCMGHPPDMLDNLANNHQFIKPSEGELQPGVNIRVVSGSFTESGGSPKSSVMIQEDGCPEEVFVRKDEVIAEEDGFAEKIAEKAKLLPSLEASYKLLSKVLEAADDAEEEQNIARKAYSIEDISIEHLKAPDTPLHKLEKYADDLAGGVSSPLKSLQQSPVNELTPPGSPGNLSDVSGDDMCVTVSPHRYKLGRSPRQNRSVGSDHTNSGIPRLSLAPATMSSMLSNGPHRLEEVEEAEEFEEYAATTKTGPSTVETEEALSQISDHFESPTKEGLVASSVDGHDWMSPSKRLENSIANGRKSSLVRSPFVQDLPSLLEEDDFDPVTSEWSPVPSPYKRPMSNTPKAMMRKKAQFLSPIKSVASESTKYLGGDMVEIGSIFEDGEEETFDDSSILSAPVVFDGEPLYLSQAMAARSYAKLPLTGNSSGSRSVSDDVFSALSTKPTPPTTVEGGEDGSPALEVVPQKAIRPAALAEEIIVAPPKQQSRWATLRGSFRKQPAGYTVASMVEFNSQRRTSSWSKIENKLQKTRPVEGVKAEKNRGFRKGCKKMLKAVGRSLLSATPQLSVAPWQ